MNPFSTSTWSPRVAYRLTTVLTAILSISVAACGTKEAADPLAPTGPTGRVRFVNLITDPARVPANAILEGVPFGVNLGYGGTTPSSLPSPSNAIYSPILVGDRRLVIKRTADTSVTLATINFTVTASQDRTIYATGGTGGAAVTNFITNDDNPVPPAGQARVRLVHLSPSAGVVDVFITSTTQDLSTATPTVGSIGPPDRSPYQILPAGTYRIRLVPTGTPAANRAANVLLDVASIVFPAGSARTIVAADAAAGGLPARAFTYSDRP